MVNLTTIESSRLSIISSVLHNLFSHEQNRLDKYIETIGRENEEAYSESLNQFMYMGTVYNPKRLPRMTGMSVKQLHKDLEPKMEAFFKDKKMIDDDRQYIKQTLWKLFNYANDLQDLRNLMPECIIKYIDELRGLDRTKTLDEMLNHDTNTYKKLMKTIEKIEVYSVTRMMY